MSVKIAWTDVQVDEKRRFTLSKELAHLFGRELIVAGSPEGLFFIKEEEMEDFNDQLPVNIPLRERRRNTRSLFSGAFCQRIDNHGRVVIPKTVLYFRFKKKRNLFKDFVNRIIFYPRTKKMAKV